MNQSFKNLILGAVIGVSLGIAAVYGVAKVVESRELRAESRAAADVQEAWDAYVAAQRNYLAAVKAEKAISGQPSAFSGQGSAGRGQMSEVRGQLSAKAGSWIAFDENVADFGTVDQGTESVKVFVYRNKGDQLLKIGHVTSTCGCAVAQPEPKELPPGAVGRLSVSFKSGSFSGPIQKSIIVHSNDPTAPALSLGVKANVRTLFVLEPKVAHLGEVERGKTAMRDVVIRPMTRESFTLQRVATTHPELKAEPLPMNTSGDGALRLLLSLNATRNYGPFTYAARVYFSRPQGYAKPGSAGLLELVIPVMGTVAGPLRVKPEAVFLGSVREGDRFKPQKVTLTSRSGQPVEVRSVDTSFAGLKAAVKAVRPGLEYEIELTDEGPPPSGFFQQTMRIVTADSTVPTEVKLSGVVRQAPALSWSASQQMTPMIGSRKAAKTRNGLKFAPSRLGVSFCGSRQIPTMRRGTVRTVAIQTSSLLAATTLLALAANALSPVGIPVTRALTLRRELLPARTG